MLQVLLGLCSSNIADTDGYIKTKAPIEQNRKAKQKEEEPRTPSNTVNLLASHPEQKAVTQSRHVGPVKTKDKSRAYSSMSDDRTVLQIMCATVEDVIFQGNYFKSFEVLKSPEDPHYFKVFLLREQSGNDGAIIYI